MFQKNRNQKARPKENKNSFGYFFAPGRDALASNNGLLEHGKTGPVGGNFLKARAI
jgi:hypothetical protein